MRVLAVAGGLVAAGAIAGAAAGIIGVTLWAAVMSGLRGAMVPGVWLFAGLVGAPFGAVLLPLAGFTALRRVPLGRLILTTIFGTAVGAAALASLFPSGWLVGAISGFLAATGWLWYRFRRG
jgi:hypothetical protein